MKDIRNKYTHKEVTYIPMSQRMPRVLSEESMLASTSHECSTVSPAQVYPSPSLRTQLHQAKPTRRHDTTRHQEREKKEGAHLRENGPDIRTLVSRVLVQRAP